MAVSASRAGYDFCGYGENSVCPLHGPCDCRDDDLGAFDASDYEVDLVERDEEGRLFSPTRRLIIRRGGKLIEVSGSPARETRG